MPLEVGEQKASEKEVKKSMRREVNEQRLEKKKLGNPCCQVIKQSLWKKRLGYLCHAKLGSWLQITRVNR